MNLSRRTFIASAAILPVACGVPLGFEHGASVAQPNPTPSIRPPQVGQEWTYIKRNVFDGKVLGVINERVAQVGATITIERSEDGAMLPSEIQSPWGFASTDPQWPKLMSFSPALPLWPLEMSSNWSQQFISKYSIAGFSDAKLNWQEHMSAQGWENITVPAGQFLALKFQTLINYESHDDNKVNCIRKETIWFAPSIGRWVARETSGSYMIFGEIGAPIQEDRLQWQLSAYK